MKLCFYLIIVSFIVSCTTEPIEPVENDPLKDLPNLGPIRFDAPAIGQRNKYVYFTGTKDDISFSYTGDTVVLAITGTSSAGWILSEFLTPKSDLKATSSYADSIFTRTLTIRTDSIIITKPTQYAYNSFFLYGERLAFQAFPVPDTEPYNEKCRPLFEYSINKWVEYSSNFNHSGTTFSKVNIYFDYRAMSGDGTGLMHAYDPTKRFVRIAWVSYWDLYKVRGWDLLPD